jgi:hypothetical protein
MGVAEGVINETMVAVGCRVCVGAMVAVGVTSVFGRVGVHVGSSWIGVGVEVAGSLDAAFLGLSGLMAESGTRKTAIKYNTRQNVTIRERILIRSHASRRPPRLCDVEESS